MHITPRTALALPHLLASNTSHTACALPHLLARAPSLAGGKFSLEHVPPEEHPVFSIAPTRATIEPKESATFVVSGLAHFPVSRRPGGKDEVGTRAAAAASCAVCVHAHEGLMCIVCERALLLVCFRA